MSDRRRRARRGPGAAGHDAHQRIRTWLVNGADEELSRDVMVHAALCSDCRLQIAAFDLLDVVDLDRAGFPPHAEAVARRSRPNARRAVAATGAMAVSAVAIVAGVAATGWRPALGGQHAVGSNGPTQEVLANTGRPQPTATPAPTPRVAATHSPTRRGSSQPSTIAPATVAPPAVTLPTAEPTLRPTSIPRPTATARPTPPPTATPEPTVAATPSPPTGTPSTTPGP